MVVSDPVADETVQRRPGPTPNGGAYSVAYFQNDAGEPTRKDQATRVEIHECREDGEVIFRTYGERALNTRDPRGGAGRG